MVENPPGDRLLIVDDDPAVGSLFKDVGESAGFEVEVAEDSSTVLKTVRLWHPTVIMLDLAMPGVDGVQVLRGLAQEKCAAHVIVASGADLKVVDSAVQLGQECGLKMGGAVQKPGDVVTLREFLGQFQSSRRGTLSADDLAAAIAADQVFLEYQPIFDCRLARMTGVEALIRWRHPDLGIIRPDQFIALAEQTDLIHGLTDWVVRAAAQQVALWQANGLTLEISANISARNLEELDLPDRLYQHCQDAGVDCGAMTLELTETGAMREAVLMLDVLTRLRLKGFKLSIDDFGTGYSSLVQLQQMPFSEVKIDRSFVGQMMTNHGCMTIAEIIIDLAHRLGLRSVAEGVEDEDTLRTLMALGCDAAQGYYFKPPLAADLIPSFVSAYRSIQPGPTERRRPPREYRSGWHLRWPLVRLPDARVSPDQDRSTLM